jgi:hypothetical protein
MTQELRKLADDLEAEFTQGRISNHNGRRAAAEIRLLLDRVEKAEKDLNAEFAEHRSLGRLAKQATDALLRRGRNMATHDAAVVQLINQATKRLHI